MATGQWRKIAAIGTITAVVLAIVGIAWAGGGKFVAVEKDLSSVRSNAAEDRGAIKDIAVIVTNLKNKQASDYRELKEDSHASELRDERQTTQYSAILSHMTQQTAHDQIADATDRKMLVDIGKIQTKLESLTKDDK